MKRFLLLLLLPLCACAALTGMAFAGVSNYTADAETQAARLMHMVLVYESAYAGGDSVESNAVVARLAKAVSARVCLFTEDGDLLIDSAAGQPPVPQYYSATDVVRADGTVVSVAVARRGGIYNVDAFTLLTESDGGTVILSVSLPMDRFGRLLALRRAAVLTELLWMAATVFAVLLPVAAHRRPAPPDPAPALKKRLDRIEIYANERISLLSTVLTNIDSGIVLFGPDGSLLLMNPRAQSITGGRSRLFFPNRADPGSDFPPVLSTVREMARSCGQSQQPVLRDLHTDDGKILSVRISVIYSKYIPYTFYGTQVLISDVTEKRRMEKSKDEFVSNVSHELRTPLTLISGFAETLQNWHGMSADDCSRAVEIIGIESERLNHMITQLLDLSHIESRMGAARKEPFNATDAIRSTLPTVQALAEQYRITLQTELPAEPVELLGSRMSVTQIVTNLCENAVKYTPAGGHVRLNVRRGMRHLTILVEDNGIGIPPADIPHIFERFYRVEKSRNTKRGGSGLGLAITRGLVAELGGTISVRSTPRQGSTFIVRLPLPHRPADEKSPGRPAGGSELKQPD